MNELYTQTLKDFTKSCDRSKYIIVGSVALLSYTQKHGYDREVHDLDIIMEKTAADITKNKFLDLGYNTETFINKRMPFYKKLMKHSKDRYMRLTKDGINVEILSSNYSEKNNLLVFEIYPGIKAGIPKEELVESNFNGVSFTTVSKEMLYVIKKFANYSFGKISKYKKNQRLKDLEQLKKLVDHNRAVNIGNKCRIYLLGFTLKIPRFIYR